MGIGPCCRFMEEKLRQKDTVIEKLRLKNSTIKAQIAKMEQQARVSDVGY